MKKLDYYAHTFSQYHNFMLLDIYCLSNILKSGYLLSRRILNMSEDDAMFNGMDYISLCDLSKTHPKISAYNLYVKNGASLLFSKDESIKTVIPQIITLDKRYPDIDKEIHYFGMKGRYSNLIDEVQVKDKVSLQYLIGLSVSLKAMKGTHSNKYILGYLNMMKELLMGYGHFVPIINLDDEKEIELSKIKL